MRRFNRSKFPKDLKNWQGMFAVIYSDRNAAELKERLDMILGEPTLFNPAPDDTLYRLRMLLSLFHLVEELGEMGRALRQRYFSAEALRDEIADMFAWTMGAANMIAMHPEASDFCLQDILWRCYPGVCGLCRQNPCRCAAAPNEDLLEIAQQQSVSNTDALVKSIGSQEAWLRVQSIADADHVARKRASPLALLVIDVNDFKSVNERPGGHLQGAHVLTAIGERLREICGGKDFAFRVGGDEFAVLLGQCDIEHARSMTDRIKSGIAEHGFRDTQDDSTFQVTVSVGKSLTDDGTVTLTRLYQLADAEQATDKTAYRQGQDDS